MKTMSEKARGKQRMQFVHEQLSARPARAATPEDNAAQAAQDAQVARDLEEAQRLCDRYAEQTARITKMCDDLDGLDGLDTLDDAVGPAFRHSSAMSMPLLCGVSDVDEDASDDAREPMYRSMGRPRSPTKKPYDGRFPRAPRTPRIPNTGPSLQSSPKRGPLQFAHDNIVVEELDRREHR